MHLFIEGWVGSHPTETVAGRHSGRQRQAVLTVRLDPSTLKLDSVAFSSSSLQDRLERGQHKTLLNFNFNF
jgi:hypothetical protein